VAFALATMFAAISGVLYVHFIGLSYPTTWILSLSLNILAIIVIGGMRSIGGALLGSFIVYGLSDLVIKNIPVIGDVYGLANMVIGILIIIVILFYPLGLINIFRDVFRLIKKLVNYLKSKNSKLMEGENSDK
jgi:branched-chain amino acid transport system permease protein